MGEHIKGDSLHRRKMLAASMAASTMTLLGCASGAPTALRESASDSEPLPQWAQNIVKGFADIKANPWVQAAIPLVQGAAFIWSAYSAYQTSQQLTRIESKLAEVAAKVDEILRLVSALPEFIHSELQKNTQQTILSEVIATQTIANGIATKAIYYKDGVLQPQLIRGDDRAQLKQLGNNCLLKANQLGYWMDTAISVGQCYAAYCFIYGLIKEAYVLPQVARSQMIDVYAKQWLYLQSLYAKRIEEVDKKVKELAAVPRTLLIAIERRHHSVTPFDPPPVYYLLDIPYRPEIGYNSDNCIMRDAFDFSAGRQPGPWSVDLLTGIGLFWDRGSALLGKELIIDRLQKAWIAKEAAARQRQEVAVQIRVTDSQKKIAENLITH